MSAWFLLAALGTIAFFSVLVAVIVLLFTYKWNKMMVEIRVAAEAEEGARIWKERAVDDLVSRVRSGTSSPTEPTTHPGGEPLPTPDQMSSHRVAQELQGVLNG